MKRNYIFKDGKVYQLIESDREYKERKKKEGYEQGHILGCQYSIWGRSMPDIDRKQVEKFRLDYVEYCRGFKDGYEGKEPNYNGN